MAKYARARRARVRLWEGAGARTFRVEGDGVGFDPAVACPGSGLRNMADRLAALDGTPEVRSRPGAGTAVTGRIPARAMGTIG